MKLQIEKAVYGGAGLAHQTEGDGAGKARKEGSGDCMLRQTT